MIRRLAICVAFATWCFLNTRTELAQGKSVYFARFAPLHSVVVPALCWEVLIAGAMWGTWELLRLHGLSRSPLARFLFLSSCFVPFGIASVALLRAAPLDLTPVVRRPWFWPMALVLGVSLLLLALRRSYDPSRLIAELFLYSWPVLALVLFQAAHVTLFKYSQESYKDGPTAKPLPPAPRQVRFVWIIFDELSQAIAFEKRPAGLVLPQLDRLRSESFYSSSAESPSRSTDTAMPSLILGEQVETATPEGPETLRLRLRGHSQEIAWSDVPNVFDSARKLGFNTALIGWFHPYGRLLNRSLTKCAWIAGWLASGVEEPTEPQPLPDAMWNRARLQVATLPLVGHLPGFFPGIYHRRAKIERYSYLLDCAREAVADPAIGLVLIHLPIPHPPAIYNQSSGQITADGRIGYLDNVALADRTLGMLRQSLEQAGLWDRTAVLVSADHGWRPALWRGTPEWTAGEEAASHSDTYGVPFLLKLPSQKAGFVYQKRFNTIITRRVITDTLSGALTNPGQLPDNIDRDSNSGQTLRYPE